MSSALLTRREREAGNRERTSATFLAVSVEYAGDAGATDGYRESTADEDKRAGQTAETEKPRLQRDGEQKRQKVRERGSLEAEREEAIVGKGMGGGERWRG